MGRMAGFLRNRCDEIYPDHENCNSKWYYWDRLNLLWVHDPDISLVCMGKFQFCMKKIISKIN